MRRIGAISALKYSVCGEVVLDSASASGLKVRLNPKPYPLDPIPLTLTPNP